jgi:hypothetical protein
MTIYFAMMPAADGTPAPAFFLTEKAAPAHAVKITQRRHVELLERQAEGFAIVAGKGGKPKIVGRPTNDDARRAALTRAIKREAARRIEAVAPVWRQINDSRAPSPEGARRFAQIDAIRAASNAFENTLANLPAAQLEAFRVAAHPLWPEFD